MEVKVAIWFIISAIALVGGQDNAQTRIPEALRECYQNATLMDRDFRLPSTINVLIDLIRKIEDSPNGNNMDIRTITISLIHKFKLDGVSRSRTISASSHALPYSPLEFQFYKHRLLLSRLLPGNALLFPNSSITSIEKCSLHHMLSSTVDRSVREDEGTVCNRLAQYRTHRLPRHVDIPSHPISDDVEVLDNSVLFQKMRKGNLQNVTPDPPEGDTGFEIIPGILYDQRDTGSNSQCPTEDGVVYTQWGAVAAGTLLAGIAAGLENQLVPLNQLTSTNLTLRVDNRYAATLAGDLAEVALRQGPLGDQNIVIGAAGGWNNTLAPRWYFLSQSTNYEYTDAEIRGGLDGLILGLNVQNFRQTSATLKLSQLLDMYYSQRGVFSDVIRACNRKSLLAQVAPTQTLLEQSLAFTHYLDDEMPHQATITEDGLQEYATNSVNTYNSYVPNNLNDLTCTVTSNSLASLTSMRAAVDLFIVLDTSWNYNDIYPSLSYLVDNLDVSKYGSNVTLLNARDGSIIANSSHYLSQFHEVYNILQHQRAPSGFDLPTVLLNLRNISNTRMEHNRASGWTGGQSSVVLFFLNTATVNDADMTYAIEQKRIFREQVPDLYFLYAATGNRERFNLLVRDTADDLFVISTTSTSENVGTQINPIVERIRRIPLRIINPWCGSNWNPSGSGTKQLDYYVEPQKTVYLRLLPNYFHVSSGSRVVRIQGGGYGTLTVCYSRSPLINRLNDTQLNPTCEDIVQNTIEIRLENFCDGYDYITLCPPLYITARAPAATTTPQARCTENACRFPDSLRFTINVVDLGCFSGNSGITASFAYIVLAVILNIRYYFI